MTRRPAPLDLVLTALLVLLGAASFGWVFGWTSAEVLVWPAIAVSAVVPVVLAGLLRRAGTSLLVAVVVQAVVALVVGTALVLAAGGAPGTFAAGLVEAWSSLLSFTLPAGGDPQLLVVPIVVTWVAAVVAAEATMRSRSPFAPLVAAIALVVGARLFGPTGTEGSPLGHVAIAAGMVAVGLLLASRRSAELAAPTPSVDADDLDDAPRPVLTGWLRAALPVAVIATLVAGAVALVLPSGRSAASLRTLVDPPPPADLAVANPLDSLTADLADAAQPVLDLTMTVGPIPAGTSLLGGASPPLRLVTLDTYDGVEWSSSGRYLRAGSELPAPAGASATTVEVRQDIDIASLAGPWLPAVSSPRSVDLAGADVSSADAPVLAFDAASGGLVLENPSIGEPVRYAVVSQVPAVTAADLAAAGLPASSAFAGDIALPPGLPAGLGAVADRAMGGAASPFQQLAALEAWLRTNGELDLEAPGGNSYAALQRFLVPDQSTGASAGTLPARPTTAGSGLPDLSAVHVGNPQQFATAFAVIARSRGLPARVVIGYRTDAAAGPSTVVRGQTAVWPEAYLDGIGWVPFDPTPALGSAPSRPTPPQVDEVAQAKTDAAAEADRTDRSIPPPANPIVEAEDDGPARNPLVVLAVLVALALLVALGVVVARPLRARSRRRRTERSRRAARTPREQVLGAWHHVVDALEDAGAPPLAAATVADVVEVVDARWGPAVAGQVAALGAVVNDTLFDPAGDGAEAAGVWPMADAVVATVRATSPVPVPAPAEPVAA